MSETKKWRVTFEIADTPEARKHFTKEQIRRDVQSALIDEYVCWYGIKLSVPRVEALAKAKGESA